MKQRAAFDQDPEAFCHSFEEESATLSRHIRQAADHYPNVTIEDEKMMEIAQLCISMGVDGHRADIVTLKTAKALCAYKGRDRVTDDDISRAAELALPHRLRRQPFENIPDTAMNLKPEARP